MARRTATSLRSTLTLLIFGLALVPALVTLAAVYWPQGPDRILSRDLALLALWCSLLAVLAWVLGRATAARLLRPLTRVASWSQAVARDPRTERAELQFGPNAAPSEVVELSRSITSMVEALRWEVHHRDILVDALVHDIRTPLLAIRNSLSLVRFGAGSERIGMDITRETIAEVQSTLSLINDVALAHRLERSLVSAKREHIDLLVLANRVAERLRIASAGSGCSIDVWGTASSVIGDVTALDRALTNLLDNALRFAVHGARVEVFPGMLRIIDDGPGMDWSPGRSFAPYQYGPGNGSLGLGLYIASTILEAHGGRLLLETTGPEGTVLLAYIGAAKVP